MILASVTLVFCVLVILVIWRPPIAMAPVICLFSLEQYLMANEPFFLTHASVVNYAVGFLILFGLLSNLVRGRMRRVDWPAAGWILFGLYGLYICSYLWTLSPASTLMCLRHAWPYTLIIVLAMPFLFNNMQDIRTGLAATLIAGSLLAALLLTGTHVHEWGRTISFAGEMVNRYGQERVGRGNPLAIASFGGRLAVLAILLHSFRLGGTWRIARWVIVLIGIGLIIRSDTRGQLIALFLAAALTYGFSRTTTSLRTIVGFSFAAIVVAAGTSWAFQTFSMLGAGRYQADQMLRAFESTRGEMCRIMLEAWATSSPFNFLFGLGGAAAWDSRLVGGYPHVVVIETLTELGLVGFLMLMTFFALVAWSVLRLIKMTSNEPKDRELVAALTALFLSELILNFKQGSLIFSYDMFMTALLITRLDMSQSRAVADAKRQYLQWRQYFQAQRLATGGGMRQGSS